MEIRHCPRCNIPPARIYEPYTYQLRDGQTRIVQQSYCSNCQKTYSQRGRSTKQPRLKPTKKRTLADLTLEEIQQQIHNGDHRWLSGRGWPTLRTRILERDKYQCQIQGPTCTQHAQVDHITPRLEGGDNHPDNLRAACGPCNGSRFQWEQRRCADCGSHNVERVLA